MKLFTILILTSLLFLFTTKTATVESTTIQSNQFIIETNITPTPAPLQSSVQSGFVDSTNGKPTRLAVSANFIDYGPITPTNPIKRKINISADPGSSHGYTLFSFEDHPLRSEASPLASLLSDGQTIPDTTCDNGACSENTPSTWTNPFTFGFGYSFDDPDSIPIQSGSIGDDLLYRQFADLSKNEPMTAIAPQEMTIKLNVGQSFDPERLVLSEVEGSRRANYQNTLIFLVLPKI